jgi:hypothetical protein
MRVGVKGADGESVMVERDEVECFLANLIYKVCYFTILAIFRSRHLPSSGSWQPAARYMGTLADEDNRT